MTSTDPGRPAVRPTRQRRAVAAALAGFDDFRSAQDVHEAMRQTDQRVGLATVYRTLQAMVEGGELDMGKLEQIDALSVEGLADARRIVNALMPAELESTALGDALARMLERLIDETGIEATLHADDDLPSLGIDAEVETYESSKLTSVILDGEFDTFEWGWYVEPDPDSMLSYMTCGQLGNWSDSWYCNEEYDELYDAQHVEMDDAARAEMVKQMQEILYDDAPYLVTAYSSIGVLVGGVVMRGCEASSWGHGRRW